MFCILQDITGGVWKTTNLQANYTSVAFDHITDDLQTQSAGALTIDPTTPEIIYYASGGSVEYFAYNFYGIGVFKSTNGGQSWTGPYRTGLPNLIHSYRMAVSPNHDIYLALGMDSEYGGLYKSTDGGVTWSHAPNIRLGYTCSDVAISDNGLNIYALGQSVSNDGIGYWVSTNGGISFQEKTFDPGFIGFSRARSQLSICKLNPSLIYEFL